MEKKETTNQELIQFLLKRFDHLKQVRALNEALRWEALAYANHRTKEASLTNCPVPDIELYATEGVVAIENFVNGFSGNLVSINQNWASFRYESKDFTQQDDIPNANEFLGTVQKLTMSELAQSNFYAENRLADKDSFITGCSAMFIDNDKEEKICTFKTLPPWDWWCDTNKNGKYDTFFYRKRMDAFKALEMFGKDCPESIKEAAYKQDGKDPTTYEFLLCIFPRKKPYVNGPTPFVKKRKFAAIWLYLSSGTDGITETVSKDEIVQISGYEKFPVVIHCWDQDGDNPYGTSPVIRNLPTLRKLNMYAYEEALTVQKNNHSAFVMTPAVEEQFSDDPFAHIIVPSMEQAPQPLNQPQTIDGAIKLRAELVDYISRIFYNDMFNYLSRQDKVFTATQVNAVKSEELTLLSAIFGNVQSQKIDKIIKYVVYLMGKNKRLPEGANEALEEGGKLKIVLDSTLAQTLRSYTFRDSGLADLELIERVANVANASQSSEIAGMLDNVEPNNLMRTIMFGNGSDPSVIRDKSEVMQIQMARAQQQAQMAQTQQQLAESEMIRNMGGMANNNNSTGRNQYQ